MRTIAVLGGGIGGLAASYYLCKNPQVTKIIVLESSSRFGGWLWSTRRSDGAIFEHGPRGIRPAGAVGRNTLNMVDELGLAEEILPVTYSHVASKNRYLYVKEQLHRMPSGISGLVRTVPPFSRPLLSSLAMEMLVKKSKADDESVHAFFSRRLGNELANIAVDSLCRGVFAGDCRKLSVRSCFPPFYNAEQRRGSLILGMLLGSEPTVIFRLHENNGSLHSQRLTYWRNMVDLVDMLDNLSGPTPVVHSSPLAQRSIKESWAQWSLQRGVESLPETITNYLQQSGRVQLHRDAAVRHISPSTSGWKIHLEDGIISADHIISALPARALSSALPSSCQPLIQDLQDISMVTVAVVNLEYEGSILPVMGFGHLVPSSEDPGLLGVVYDSVSFPEHNRPNGQTTRLTVMIGGAWFQEEFGAPEMVTEDRLLTRAVEAVQCHLGVTTAPCWSRVALHRDCIPQYYQGHYRKVESMRSFIRKNNFSLSLMGSCYDGVSVNDVIFSGWKAVEELLRTGV